MQPVPLTEKFDAAPIPNTPGTPADSPRHFQFVDSLRGLAILAVIMVHCCLNGSNIHWRAHDFAMQGQYGVQLFFVVSAFTLFWSMQSRSGLERRPLLAFYTRRFFRIAPLFYLAALFYTEQKWAWHMDYGFRTFGPMQFIATLLFVHGWHPSSVNVVVPGGWSIGAEFMFYLCIPLLFSRVRTLTTALWLTLITAVIVSLLAPLAGKMLIHHVHPPDMSRFAAIADGPTRIAAIAEHQKKWELFLGDFVKWSFPSQVPVFCLGFVLYFLLRDRISARMPGLSPATVPVEGGKSLGLFLVASSFFLVFGKVPPQVLCAVAFVALAYGLAMFPFSILVNPVTRFIGKVSFSAYIWHFWLLDRIRPQMHFVDFHKSKTVNGTVRFALAYIATVLLTMGVATISYYLIELPGQNMGRLLIARMAWGRKPRTQKTEIAMSVPSPSGI